MQGMKAQRERKTAVSRLKNWMGISDIVNLHLVCFLPHEFCFLLSSISSMQAMHFKAWNVYSSLCRCPLWLHCLSGSLIFTTWSHSHTLQSSAQNCTVSQSTVFSCLVFLACYRSQSTWHAIFHPGRQPYNPPYMVFSLSYLSWRPILSYSFITNWGKDFTHHITWPWNYGNTHKNSSYIFNSTYLELLPTCITDTLKLCLRFKSELT